MTLSGLAGSDAALKVHALQYCMSRETLTIVDNLGLTESQKADEAQIIAALKQYVQGRINETVERRNFRQRRQAPGESFDDYLVSLRELAKTCNFCNNDCLQNNLRDQIVEGIIDTDVVQDLLKEHSLTLEKAILTCRAMEAAKRELGPRQGPPTPVIDASLCESVNTVNLDSTSSESLCVVSRYKQTKGKRQSTSHCKKTVVDLTVIVILTNSYAV